LWYLLLANTTFAYTHADTLRGSNGRGRDWWDVKRYDLSIELNTAKKSITGNCEINFTIIKQPIDSMQIDLQQPLIIDEVSLLIQILPEKAMGQNPIFNNPQTISLPFEQDGNVCWVKYGFHKFNKNEKQQDFIKTGNTDNTVYKYQLSIQYHGQPRVAKNPPWDGGFIWGKDSTGKAWYSVACQGLGASAWWPCKDAQWDKPDSGVSIAIYPQSYSWKEEPDSVLVISNGKFFSKWNVMDDLMPGTNDGETWHWQVKNPINTYDVTFYIGDYAHWSDTLMGEKGKLDLDFYALRYNEAKAREQFKIVKPMLHCFEYWMGPYPFYEDGYKLVEAPYLGMEHQSAVAYGNQYKMGYLGMDRSGTGVGLLFDFIIVHESGHEWFGNSVTAYDIADNWIHEGITTYSETLFAECQFGKEKAFEYCRGEWKNIRNDKPVIGDYGVNNEGSGDMYDKGAAIIHMIRMMINDDEKFRGLLHGINEKWYHGIVTSKELEKYIADYTGLDLTAFFNEYLRTTQIPELEYYIKHRKLFFRFNNTTRGFTLPIEATDGTKKINIHPTADWQKVKWKGGYNLSFSKDFLIHIKS
jgi:aminopeptidase N